MDSRTWMAETLP